MRRSRGQGELVQTPSDSLSDLCCSCIMEERISIIMGRGPVLRRPAYTGPVGPKGGWASLFRMEPPEN
eukprot:15450104-Alexandrium_andersonii.AAC.1